MNKKILIHQINQGHSTWKMAELNDCTQANIRYWLKKYDLKTKVVTNLEKGIRSCLTCGTIQPLDNFYKRGKKYMSHCKTCYQITYTQRSRRNKQQAIDYLGGKCSNCGYNKCNAALDFHHINPNDKLHEVARLFKDKTFNKRLKLELDKCVLLCANCHREHHSSSS